MSQRLNVFDTKARVVLVFDPDHMRKIDRDRITRIIDTALELTDIPGFRGCLPCAASGIDELAFSSRVLPALSATQQG
ncbi:MAG: hypothetical protein M3O70_01875 [Actinomycetota bacterium]|nr:hypothetical protein [Actinomycetota bacterium]